MNKELSVPYGLSAATLLTAMTFGLLCGVLYVLNTKSPQTLPEFFYPKMENYRFQWWHLLPGVAGFLIVLLTPLAIHHLGAAKVSIAIVCTQILLSVAWDLWQGSLSLPPTRWWGLGLVLLGSLLFHRG